MEFELNALIFAPIIVPTECNGCGRSIESETWAVQIPGVSGAMCGTCAQPLVEVAFRSPMTLHDPIVESAIDEIRLHDLIGQEVPDIDVWKDADGRRCWEVTGTEPDDPCELIGRISRVGDVVELTRFLQFDPFAVADDGEVNR